MPITTFDELDDAARAQVADYLAHAARSFSHLSASERDEIVEDLGEHLRDVLESGDGPDRVSAVIAELGHPEPDADPVDPGHRLSGRILGVPYELRVPTAQHVSSRLWDPSNPRIFVPRIFGIGWDVNLGAVAVRLHLIEPDAEDVPFSSTPAWAFTAGIAVPCVLLAGMLGSYVALASRFPEQLPSHWNLAGEPDGWWAPITAFGLLFALSAVPTVWALFAAARRHEPLERGALIGLASFMSALAAAIWALTLITTFTGFSAWWLPPALIFGSFLVPMGVLLGLARAGRAVELQRDLAHRGGESR